MTSASQGSVTRWISDLKGGDQDAASRIWERYFLSLVRIAQKRLNRVPRRGSSEDGEDAALSAFHSLCAGAAGGRFDRLTDRDDLWRLLVVITARKALDQIQRERRRKRGGGRVVGEAVLAEGNAGTRHGARLDEIVGTATTAEFATLIAEEFRLRLAALGDDGLRQIATWRMEGYRNEEIATRLGCVTRSVERKLRLIRQTWLGANS